MPRNYFFICSRLRAFTYDSSVTPWCDRERGQRGGWGAGRGARKGAVERAGQARAKIVERDEEGWTGGCG